MVHTVVGTAANVRDVTQAQALLHREETDAFGDAGYQGIETRAENLDVPVTWPAAICPSKRKAWPGTPLEELLERIEHAKASIRAKVEPPFHVVKNLFRHCKIPGPGQEHGPTLLAVRVRQSGASATLGARR